MGERGREGRVEAAFRELYAACGLPPPAVRMEATERSYRKSASILSVERNALATSLAVLSHGLAAMAAAVFFFAFYMANFAHGEPRTGYVAAAMALLLIAARIARWKASEVNGWSVFLARQVGLRSIRSTPAAMASAFSSAMAARAGGIAVHAGGSPAADPVFMELCFRLGRRLILDPGSDPRMTALSGAPDPGEGAPRVLRLAAAASALVEEAVLMDGFVLALVPGCPRPAPVRPLALMARRPEAPFGQVDEDGRPLPALDHLLAASARAAVILGAESAERNLRALGVGECADALAVRPFGEDPSGGLYRFGPDLLMVRVEDRVAGPDGRPLVHWLTVPPHVLTAREGVAWSYGLAEAAYGPTSES